MNVLLYLLSIDIITWSSHPCARYVSGWHLPVSQLEFILTDIWKYKKNSSIDLRKFIGSILMVTFVRCSLSQHLVASIYTLADEQILVERLRPSTTFIMRVRALSEVGYGDYFSVTVMTRNVGKLYGTLLWTLGTAW